MAQKEIRNEFIKALNKFKEKIKPYIGAYRYADITEIRINDKIASVCVVFRPDYFERVEYELTTTFKIIRYCDNPTKIFDLLEKLSKGEKSDLIFNLEDIINSNFIGNGSVNIYSDSWEAITLKVYSSKTIKDLISDIDFNILYKKLKEKYDVNNLSEFLSRILKLPSSFEFDSNVSPRIYIYAPIYVNIYRFGLDDNKVKIYIKACKALRRHNISLFLKVIDKQGFISPKNVCFNRANKLADISEYFSIFVYEYDIDVNNLKEIRVKLRDSNNEEFKYVELNVEKLIKVKQKIKISSRERFKTLINTIGVEKIILLLLVIVFLSVIILGYYHHLIYLDFHLDLAILANFITAVAALLTAIITLKLVKLNESETWRPVAKEALEKIRKLESKIQSIRSSIEDDMFVNYSEIFELAKYLELEPHLCVIVYGKCPMLRLDLSKLVESLIEYNANIKRKKSQKALKCIDNTLKKINKLKIILHKEYRVPPDKPKNPLQL